MTRMAVRGGHRATVHVPAHKRPGQKGTRKPQFTEFADMRLTTSTVDLVVFRYTLEAAQPELKGFRVYPEPPVSPKRSWKEPLPGDLIHHVDGVAVDPKVLQGLLTAHLGRYEIYQETHPTVPDAYTVSFLVRRGTPDPVDGTLPDDERRQAEEHQRALLGRQREAMVTLCRCKGTASIYISASATGDGRKAVFIDLMAVPQSGKHEQTVRFSRNGLVFEEHIPGRKKEKHKKR